VSCRALHCTTLHDNALYYSLLYTALHGTALRCTVLTLLTSAGTACAALRSVSHDDFSSADTLSHAQPSSSIAADFLLLALLRVQLSIAAAFCCHRASHLLTPSFSSFLPFFLSSFFSFPFSFIPLPSLSFHRSSPESTCLLALATPPFFPRCYAKAATPPPLLPLPLQARTLVRVALPCVSRWLSAS
jgi:hypothetical protein